jgi:sugar (pentulose or hexulose) kinase
MVTIGIDIGTTRVKGCIVKDGKIIFRKFFKFPVIDIDGKKEVNEKELWKKMKRVLKKIFEFTEKNRIEIESIGITSQAQTFITIDRNYKFLTGFILWNDRRAEIESEILNEKFSSFYNFSGLPYFIPELMVCKVLYLKRNFPEIFKNTYKFLLINEWLIFKLTGNFYGDDVNFGMSGFFDIKKRELNQEILEFLNLKKENFSEIYPSGKFFSFLKEDICEEFKIRNKIRVSSCGNDQTTSAIGAGIDKNTCFINLGTAFVFYIIVEEIPEKIENIQMCGIFPFGNYFLLSCDGDFGNYVKNLKDLRGDEKVYFYFKKNFDIIEKYFKGDKFLISGGYAKRFLNYLKKNFKLNLIYSGENTGFKGIEKIIGGQNLL